jgi:hypothetical protein
MAALPPRQSHPPVENLCSLGPASWLHLASSQSRRSITVGWEMEVTWRRYGRRTRHRYQWHWSEDRCCPLLMKHEERKRIPAGPNGRRYWEGPGAPPFGFQQPTGLAPCKQPRAESTAAAKGRGTRPNVNPAVIQASKRSSQCGAQTPQGGGKENLHKDR